MALEGLSTMTPLLHANKPVFKLGLGLTIGLACLMMGISFGMGKHEFFLVLNGNGGPIADVFFSWATYLGDGLIWVPIGILILWKFRQKWVLVFATILLSTLWVNIGKRVIYPNEQRPTAVVLPRSDIHTVPGIELHTQNSFPSGHTTTAFSVFLLALCFWESWAVFFIGLALASAAAYSRVYLAQHFPLDLAGGMLGAALTLVLSLRAQAAWTTKAPSVHTKT
ncbi:MAG: phosphatase PAP2 family protein [Sphingobacteriia bacterium]|nr:MAG: phosphatase PAP2 family protein [Sphingobacteriia bacterium]